MYQWMLVQEKHDYMWFIVTYRTLDRQFETKFEKATIDSVSDQVDFNKM